MRRLLLLPVFLLVVSSLAVAWSPSAGNAWALKRTGDEMWVYTRDRAGSPIKEVKLVMHVDASIDDINDVLNSAERQPEWVFKCVEGRTLGGDLKTGWYYYSRIDMPWPMDDRDVVGKVTGGQSGSSYESRTVAAPDKTAKVEDCVRLTTFEVNTSYRAMPSGKTEVTYQLYSEPGGSVPTWLINLFVDKGPVETMTRLRDLVEG